MVESHHGSLHPTELSVDSDRRGLCRQERTKETENGSAKGDVRRSATRVDGWFVCEQGGDRIAFTRGRGAVIMVGHPFTEAVLSSGRPRANATHFVSRRRQPRATHQFAFAQKPTLARTDQCEPPTK